VKVFAMCGSLRKASYSKLLLQNTVRLVPAGVTIDAYDDLRVLPYYDQDDEHDPPHVVREFKARAKAADALLFVTPEYNHSLPGVLKNAVDWLSRPQADNNFAGKPAAVFGCGNSTFGAVRLQIAFREILWSVGAEIVPKLELIVFKASERFDANGVLVDRVVIDGIHKSLALMQARV
jgi:chromate reductase